MRCGSGLTPMLRTPSAALNGLVPDNLPVLSRPRDGAMLGGVCAGLARKWQVDPNLLRIAVVVLVFFGGLGLAAYGAGLLLMPRDGQGELPVRRLLPFTRSWPTAGVVAATIGVLALLTGLPSNGIGLGPLAVIFAVWFFGFRNHGTRSTAPVPEPTPFERQAEAWRDRLAEQQTPGFAPAQLAAAQPVQQWTQPYTDPADVAVRDNLPPAVVADRRRRNRLWLLAGGLSLLGIVLVTLAGVVFGLPLGPLPYAAAFLGALGITLVAATKVGRPSLMLPVTVLTAVLTVALMLPVPASVGEHVQAYTNPADLPASIELGAGEVSLDLTELDLTTDEHLSIKLGAGEVTLDLPIDTTSVVTYRIGAGQFGGPGYPNEGVDISGSEQFDFGSGTPVLRIDVEVGMGEVTVRT